MLTLQIAGVVVCLSTTLFAQLPAPPTFEVAAIKPSSDPPNSSGIYDGNDRISAKNVTLKRCIRGAYDVPESQITGGPKWVDEDRFYIEAKAAVPVGDHELMLMLQTLLADRFKLVLHRERRSVRGYTLFVAKGGLKAQPSPPDSGSTGNAQRGRIDTKGYTLAQFAMKLSQALHAPVLDATGITGKFDMNLEWSADDIQMKAPSGDLRDSGPFDGAPSIFTALREQLGLKLEAGKIAADVLVIDSAEKPSEN